MSQKVQVVFAEGERWYSYLWTGEMPLAVGDRVVCPPNWANDQYSFATVVALDTKYEGELASLAGVVDNSDGSIYYPLGDPDE